MVNPTKIRDLNSKFKNCVFSELRVNVHITLKSCPCFDPRDPMDPTDWLMNIEISGVPRRTDPCGIEKRCTLRSWAYLLLGLFYQMTCSTKLVRIFWPKGSYMFSWHFMFIVQDKKVHISELFVQLVCEGWRCQVLLTSLETKTESFFSARVFAPKWRRCVLFAILIRCVAWTTQQLGWIALMSLCKWSFTWLV